MSREPASVVAAWALGALGVVLGGTRPWGEGPPTGLGTTTVAEAPPAVRALGLAALAAAAALLLLGATARRVVGAVGVLIGLAAAVVALAGRPESPNGWPILTVACGALVAAAGAAVVARAGRWPARGERFERPAADGTPSAAGDPSARAVWDALDRGEDPSA